MLESYISSETVRRDIVDDVTQFEGFLDITMIRTAKSIFEIAVEYVCHLDDVANSVHDINVCTHCRGTLTDEETGYFQTKKQILNKKTFRHHYFRIRKESTTDWLERDKGGRWWLCKEHHVRACDNCKVRRFGREYQDKILNDDEIRVIEEQANEDRRYDGWSNLDKLRFEKPQYSYTSGGDQWSIIQASPGNKLSTKKFRDPLLDYKRTL